MNHIYKQIIKDQELQLSNQMQKKMKWLQGEILLGQNHILI